MTVTKLDPLTDERWPAFVRTHANTSVFHTRGWLEAIHRTYGYEPVAFTTSQGRELTNAVVFCSIHSWLTGRRLVSLPFSDHCEPLASGDELNEIFEYVKQGRRSNGQKYIEIRPRSSDESIARDGFSVKETFRFHCIDLRPEINSIYRSFHDSCVRRKIKRADREELQYESGRSEKLLQTFLDLHLLTRRRHKLPPQPDTWFKNIVNCIGDDVTIHVASKGDVPVSSILTLAHKTTLVYKYGCSDAQFNNMGGTPFLFWKVIQQAKSAGIEEFDLGRSDFADEGLTAFKEHLGATSQELRYYRDQPSPKKEQAAHSPHVASRLARELLSRLPDAMLSQVGDLVYPHIG